MEIQVTKGMGYYIYSPFLGPGVATDIGDVQGSPSEVYLHLQPVLIHIGFPEYFSTSQHLIFVTIIRAHRQI